MRVTIKDIGLPAGTHLGVSEMWLLRRRLKNMLENEWLSFCECDETRLGIYGREASTPDADLRSQINAYHCVHYKDMERGEVEMVWSKLSQYLGISVIPNISTNPYAQLARPRNFVLTAVFGMTVALIVGGGMLLSSAIARSNNHPTGNAIPVHTVQTPNDTTVTSARDKTFSVELETEHPQIALSRIGKLIANEKGRFAVSVAVTAVAVDAESVSDETANRKAAPADTADPTQSSWEGDVSTNAEGG